MFSELPKIFDRNYAIGYFLPVAVFLVVSLGLIKGYGLLPQLLPLDQRKDLLLGTTVLGLISWLGGICLLATNRYILRMKEGYGRLNPANFLMPIQRKHYRQLREEIAQLEEHCRVYGSKGEEIPSRMLNSLGTLMQQETIQFPDEEAWLLPTAFGNTIRAFEVYPRVMYGLDAIPGWLRILAVIPKDYRELVDNAKAQVDFWLNLWFLSILMIFEYVCIALYTRELKLLLWPPGTLVFTLIASYGARSSAAMWGEWVKAIFDVFLSDLRTKLGFPPPATKEQEQKLWGAFSQAIIYRRPSVMATAWTAVPSEHKKENLSSEL